MSARTALAAVPVTLFMGLLGAPDAQAECKPGGQINSNVVVVCEGGIDFYGVQAKSGATNISVEVKNDGSISTYNSAIWLGGGSNVSVQGSVVSDNGYAIFASGVGGQDVNIGSFAELRARDVGILASGQGPRGNVNISNAGTIGGLLNQGGIRATAGSTDNMRVDVSNAGQIAVGGTGGGIHASAGLSSTVSVNNTGHIIAASHALRAQGQDVNLRNSGALDIVRSGNGYGIYGEATFTTAKKANVTIFNDAGISFSEASGYGVGIWAQASVSTPDIFESDNRGIAKVSNHGSIIGLGRAAGGIHASGWDEAEIVNRGTIQMAGFGAGLHAESHVKALIDNNAAVTASLGIRMSVIDGHATLRNSGTVTGKITDTTAGVHTAHAVYIAARSIDAINSGDVRGGLNASSGLGVYLQGQSRTTLVNSGDIVAPTGAIQAFATGSGGRVSVTNTGKLVSGGTGIDVLGDDGAKVNNSGAIDTGGSAVLARSANGAVEVRNSGALTNSGTTSRYRITGQVNGTSGNILIDNSGRLQGGDGGGITAKMETVGLAHTVTGDVTVRNSGEMFVDNGTWGVSIWARQGTATIDNLTRIDSDGGGLFIDSAKAVINNSGALDVDGRQEAILVRASALGDSFAQVLNSGAILLNEKSLLTRAISISVTNASDAPEWGRAELTNRAEIVSLGTNNAGVLMSGTRANVAFDNSAAITVQGVAIEARSSDGNITVQNTGALSSTLQHGVLATTSRTGDILINNIAAITAQVGGIYADAAGGVAEVVNSGALSVGTAVGNTAGGIRAHGGRVAMVNHGDITMGSAGSALMGFSSSADSDVRITNYGAIDMGNSRSAAIYVGAGYGPFDDRSGFVHVNNQGDITGGIGHGIDAFAELSVVITNNRLINAGGSSAILMRTRDGGLGAMFNDSSGQLINNSLMPPPSVRGMKTTSSSTPASSPTGPAARGPGRLTSGAAAT